MNDLYDACVTFMIHSANALDLTYRDANAGLFFVVWPLTTLGLLGWLGWNARARSTLAATMSSTEPGDDS